MREPTCDDCPFFWEEWYIDDGDCGCDLDLDCGKPKFIDFICYLPNPLRKLTFKIVCIKKNIYWWLFIRPHEKEFEE